MLTLIVATMVVSLSSISDDDVVSASQPTGRDGVGETVASADAAAPAVPGPIGEGLRSAPPAASETQPNETQTDGLAASEARQRAQTERSLQLTWKQHPSIRYGSRFRLDFMARLQADAHGSSSASHGVSCLPNTCAWELHRNRIGVRGDFFKRLEFEVERELTEQELSDRDVLVGRNGKSVWKDAYINVSSIDDVQIQVGRFKVPFSLDELTSDLDNDFTYRSLGANYLTPGRDTGVTVHGRFFKRGLSYWTGIFRHDGDNARSRRISGANETVAARVTGTPFRRLTAPALKGLEIGASVAFSALPGDSIEPNGLRGRTTVTQDTFFEPLYVSGRRHRWGADLDWTIGSASARAEFTRVIDDRLQQGLGGEDLPDARAQSWYVSGSWIVTGEPKTRPIRPAREFMRGGWGAVEVAGRLERLWFDSVSTANTGAPLRNPRAETIAPSGVRVLTVGVNWILNRWITLQVNALRERVEDPERNPVANGGPLWSRVFRFQMAL